MAELIQEEDNGRMQELDASAKPTITRMWILYHKKWVQKWCADVRSPHMTSHTLSGLAGIVSSFVAAHYDPAPATWTKIWHASIVAIAGYATLMIIVAVAKALTVSSKIDYQQENEIKVLQTDIAAKTDEYIAAQKEACDALKKDLDTSRELVKALEELAQARQTISNSSDAFHAEFAKNNQLRQELERYKSNRLKEEWEKLESKFAEYGGGSNIDIEAVWSRAMDTGKLTWYLLGGWDVQSRKRFEIVINEAAGLLRASQYSIETFQELALETDSLGMWVLSVCDIEDEHLKPSGESTTHGVLTAVTGTVKDVPRKSAHACAYLASQQRWPTPHSDEQ